jgi:hypothetical protein
MRWRNKSKPGHSENVMRDPDRVQDYPGIFYREKVNVARQAEPDLGEVLFTVPAPPWMDMATTLFRRRLGAHPVAVHNGQCTGTLTGNELSTTAFIIHHFPVRRAGFQKAKIASRYREEVPASTIGICWQFPARSSTHNDGRSSSATPDKSQPQSLVESLHRYSET